MLAKLIMLWIQRFWHPQSEGELTSTEIKVILKDAGIKDIFISDTKYMIPRLEDIIEFLKINIFKFRQYVPEKYDCPIPQEVAWGLGLFFADGSCGLSKGYAGAWWKIVNANKGYLERAKKAFSEEWNAQFDIVLYDSYKKGTKTNYGIRKKDLYCLELRKAPEGRGKFIEVFRNMMYYDKQKKSPKALWENTREVKSAFIKGVIAGDGTRNQNAITVKGKLSLICLIDCIIDIGWTYQIYNHNGSYSIRYGRKHESRPYVCDYITNKKKSTIKEIISKFNISKTEAHRLTKNLEEEGYVKRLFESERRLSIIGLRPYGSWCDNYSFSLMGMSTNVLSGYAIGIIWVETGNGKHALNFFIEKDKKITYIEPQTNQVFRNKIYKPYFVVI